VVVDAADIAAVRATVASTCDCDATTGHGKYVRCARGVVRSAVNTDSLNPRCRAVLARLYRKSACGFPILNLGPRIPCLTTSRAGTVRCVIRRAATCGDSRGGRVTREACPGFESCADAGDVDGDLKVTSADGGLCTGPTCGDGNVDVGLGEECDDGFDNADAPDKCRKDCKDPTCGDGITDTLPTPEECDQGALNSDTLGNRCRTDCTDPFCGDDVVDTLTEECDDGVSNSDTADACRTNCTDPACGDSIVDSGEACDPPGSTGGACTPPPTGTSLGCTATCQCATCTDGTIDLPVETCESGVGTCATGHLCDIGVTDLCLSGPLVGQTCASDPECNSVCDGGLFPLTACTVDDDCKNCSDADCTSYCACSASHVLAMDPAASGGQVKEGTAATLAITNVTGSLTLQTGPDVVAGKSVALTPSVGLSPISADIGGVATLCLFVETDSPGSCPDGGVCSTVGCSDVGTCEEGTCTDTGTCEVANCPNPGTCDAGGCEASTCSAGACTDLGQCNTGGTCDTNGVCEAGTNICLGGSNAGGACSTTADCQVCVGGAGAGKTCTVNTDCNTCVGGSEPGSGCPTGLHAECDDACVGGSNPGGGCTTAAECGGLCVGGVKDGATCNPSNNTPDPAHNPDCRTCSSGSEIGSVCTSDGACDAGCTPGTVNGNAPCPGGDSDCWDTCVGGTLDGTPCFTQNCPNKCVNGSEDGTAGCAGGLDSECDPACVNGAAPGFACTFGDDTTCGNICRGGLKDSQAACGNGTPDDSLCTDLCGAPLGTKTCTADTDCQACAGGTNDTADCSGDATLCDGTCVGGPNNGNVCNTPLDCPDSPTAGSGVLACDTGTGAALGMPASDADFQVFQDHCIESAVDPCDSGASSVVDGSTGITVLPDANDFLCDRVGSTPDPNHTACIGPPKQSVGPLSPGFAVGDAFLSLNLTLGIRGPGQPCGTPLPGEFPVLRDFTTGVATTGVMDAMLTPNTAPASGAVLSDDITGAPFSCEAILNSVGSGAVLVRAEPEVDDTDAVNTLVDVTRTIALPSQ
jgi:hypothetical protein